MPTDRWRPTGAVAAGIAVLAWLAVIALEVAAPETRYRAAPFTQVATVAAWVVGTASTVVAAVAVPAVVFPGLTRGPRAVLAVVTAAACVGSGLVVGDLEGFDERRYFDLHRDDFATVVQVAADGVHPLPGDLGRLSVTGAAEVTRVGATRVVFLPERVLSRGPVGFAHVAGAGADAMISVLRPRRALADGWMWVED